MVKASRAGAVVVGALALMAAVLVVALCKANDDTPAATLHPIFQTATANPAPTRLGGELSPIFATATAFASQESVAPTGAPSPTQERITRWRVAAPRGLNVRAQPSLAAPILNRLSFGERVECVGGTPLAEGFRWCKLWRSGYYVAIGAVASSERALLTPQ